MCDICGVAWQRSKLVRKRDGMLYCPDDRAGRDAVTLSELNARARPSRYYPQDGGNFDSRDYGAAVDERVFSNEFDEEFG